MGRGHSGAIDWSSYVSSVFTHTIGVLDLPVGTSDGPLPFGGRPTPRRLISTFMYMLTGQRSAVLAARIIVHMLKYAPGRPAGATAAAAALSAFQHLVCLLEQYYHPSNAGRWSKPLGQLLKYATK
ncbi:hypothetical protein FOA52_005579 [Chlamydomonas sp. UWO 241]|nr:hypothetical protein FOA52_005579 [Chlamydomonas sp. UWO 241]